jgi:hypothetical protein
MDKIVLSHHKVIKTLEMNNKNKSLGALAADKFFSIIFELDIT